MRYITHCHTHKNKGKTLLSYVLALTDGQINKQTFFHQQNQRRRCTATKKITTEADREQE